VNTASFLQLTTRFGSTVPHVREYL